MLIGVQIDYQNAAYAKVLQVGQPRNIMVELDMTPEQYNWVQSIYFVRSSRQAKETHPFPSPPHHQYVVLTL
jgi:hypothetical protein